jgi:hypothetical protein
VRFGLLRRIVDWRQIHRHPGLMSGARTSSASSLRDQPVGRTREYDGAANSTFEIYNTMVGGQHAIGIVSSADPAYGVVLLNMPTNDTAAVLSASPCDIRRRTCAD